MRRRKKGLFSQAFLIFQLVLILGVAACLIYIHQLLTTYEKNQPERLVEAAIADLIQKAEDKTLFDDASLNTEGSLVAGLDLR